VERTLERGAGVENGGCIRKLSGSFHYVKLQGGVGKEEKLSGGKKGERILGLQSSSRKKRWGGEEEK